MSCTSGVAFSQPLAEQQRLHQSFPTPGCHSRDVGPTPAFGDILIPLCRCWGERLHWGFRSGFVFWQRRNCALSLGLYPQPTKKSKPQISFETLLGFYCICPNFSHCAVTLQENASFIWFFFSDTIFSFISEVILNSSSLHIMAKSADVVFMKCLILCSLCNTINECNNKQNAFFNRVRLLINIFFAFMDTF